MLSTAVAVLVVVFFWILLHVRHVRARKKDLLTMKRHAASYTDQGGDRLAG